jgi:hypothetical protein
MRDNSNQNLEINKLKTQYDALVYFIRKLDTEMIDSLLDNSLTYQDFPKYLSVQKLGHAFDKFITKGDIQLYTYTGVYLRKIGKMKLCSKSV